MNTRLLWRTLLVLLVFAVSGLLVAQLVVAHGSASGTPVAQVRLAGAMAGLFAGGAMASLLVLALAFGQRR